MARLAWGSVSWKADFSCSSDLRRLLPQLEFMGVRPRGVFSQENCSIAEFELASRSATSSHTQLEATGGLVFAGNIRLDNRDELRALLGCDDHSQLSDRELALRAFRKWGEGSAARLIGDFAFVIWDDSTRRAFLARDRFGVYPIYYALVPGGLVFGSDLGTLALSPLVAPEPDYEWLANMAACVTLPDLAERTALKEVRLLSNAHTLSITEHGVMRNQYWSLERFAETFPETDGECLQRFRELFGRSVLARLPEADSFGLELSAGLDSSAIASVLSQRLSDRGRLRCFSHIAAPGVAANTDERSLTERLGAQLGLPRVDWITSSQESASDLLSLPTRYLGYEAWSLFAQPLYREAKRSNCPVLLSGAGGDELVSSQAGQCYWEFLIRGEFRCLFREIQSEGKRKGWGGRTKLKRLLSSFLFSGFPQLAPVFSSVPTGQFPHFLNDDVARAFSIDERKREFYWYLVCGRLKNRQRRLLSNFYLASLRLPQSFALAFWQGVEVRYPMLDTRLIEFCYSLPPGLFRRDGFGRSLLRRGLPGIPDLIRWRDDKSVPAVPWYESYLADQSEKWMGQLAAENGISSLFDLQGMRKELQDWSGRSMPGSQLKTRACVLSLAALASFG